MNNNDNLVTFINTSFYEPSFSRNILVNNSYRDIINLEERTKKIDKECEKLIKGYNMIASLKDDKRFEHIAISEYKDNKRSEKDQIIYKIENSLDGYYISTGLYCGVINLGEKLPKITIKVGYSDIFFKRILNYCCGVFGDKNTNKNVSENNSIYSLLVQYLFLTSLRKVINQSIPRKYVYLQDRGYDIKGDIDINSYINKDIITYDKKISYTYPKRLEIQNIIDVLYTAIKCCKITYKDDVLPQLVEFQNYIKELYSGVKPSKKIVNNIKNEKCLFNSLYKDYKKSLEYAKVIINNNDINSGGNEKMEGVSGFLVDASFLWEMYLCNLLRINLPDWDISSQSEIKFYEDTFYKKKNYPDFVLKNRNNGIVFILDAKFKTMRFDPKYNDVDNEDIRQLHSYSLYYKLKEGENFKGAALIYPTKVDKPKDVINVDNMFGLKDSNMKFGVFAIKDPEENETIVENEKVFLNELKSFINI